MSARRHAPARESAVPRREVIDVFRTMDIETPEDRERYISYGDYGEKTKRPVYYSIQVTGTLEPADCHTSPS